MIKKLLVVGVVSLIVGLVVGALVVKVGFDDDGSPSATGGSSDAPSTGPSGMSDEDVNAVKTSIAKVDGANQDLDGQLTKTGARPTIDPSNNRTMVSSDVTQSDYDAGRQVLRIYCAGKGQLWVQFEIGNEKVTGDAPCADNPVPTEFEIELDRPLNAIDTTVTAVPLGDTLAAFSYVIYPE